MSEHLTEDLEAISHDEHLAKCVQAGGGEFWPKELHLGSVQECACGQVCVGPGEHWHTYTKTKCHTVEECK